MMDWTWARQFYDGKRVVITGGTGGIGIGLAQAFRDAGAEVLATGATDAEVEAARNSAGGITFSTLDIRSDAAIAAFADGIAALELIPCSLTSRSESRCPCRAQAGSGSSRR